MGSGCTKNNTDASVDAINNTKKPISFIIPKQIEKYSQSLTVVLDLDETLIYGRYSKTRYNTNVKGSDVCIYVRPYYTRTDIFFEENKC